MDVFSPRSDRQHDLTQTKLFSDVIVHEKTGTLMDLAFPGLVGGE